MSDALEAAAEIDPGTLALFTQPTPPARPEKMAPIPFRIAMPTPGPCLGWTFVKQRAWPRV